MDARDHAEKLLLEAAKDSDPTTMTAGLRQLADQLCLNETAEQRAIRAHEGRYLTFTETIDGMIRLDGMVDAPFGKILMKAVDSLAAKAGDIDERTPIQRRADAMIELATLAMNRGQLPDTAGEPTQITVLVPLVDLERELGLGETGEATLDGTPITPNTARMLACDAGIIPAATECRGTTGIDAVEGGVDDEGGRRVGHGASIRLSSLPFGRRGSESTKRTSRGHLKWESRSRQNSMSESASWGVPTSPARS